MDKNQANIHLKEILEIEIHCKRCSEVVQKLIRDNEESPWEYTMPQLIWCPKCSKSLT